MDLLCDTDATNGSVVVTSFEGCYTDFDQWVLKYTHYYSKRLHRNIEPDNKKKTTLHNDNDLSLHEFLIHGIFVKKTPLRKMFFDNKINNMDFVSIDSVILKSIENRNYNMRSKLYYVFYFLSLAECIYLVSWGEPANPPILLVHGFMDSAATFNILVDQLPDKYYYVGFDMPGHAKSDPFPQGLIVNQLHIVEVIRFVVERMKWKRFVYMSHSMGCVIGMFYHQLYPKYIRKMLFLDPVLPLATYYIVQHRPALWFKFIYTDYYDNYQKWNSGKPRLHTFDSAISLVVRNRSLTEEQAEVVLSRALVPMGIDTYKLSWEPRMKKISQPMLPEETLYTIMTTKTPPTLCIDASESFRDTPTIQFADNLLRKCELTLHHYYRIKVSGGHDVHITNPELIVPHIEKFLKSNKSSLKKEFIKSKL